MPLADTQSEVVSFRVEAERGLLRLLSAVGTVDEKRTDLSELVRHFARLKSSMGNAAMAAKLGLDEESLNRLTESAHDAVRRVSGASVGDDTSAAEVELSLLRLLSVLEVVGLRIEGVAPRLTFSSTLDNEALARRVRAVELVARSLVTESYKTQDALLARLRVLYKPDLIERWLAAAEGQDALSGMSFSDLAMLIVNRQEFPRYEPLFSMGRHLQLLRDRRKTLREYLDGIRSVRNSLAHHRSVSALQRQLIERYYDEITKPLSSAYQAGSTSVDPEAFLDTSKEDLDQYLGTLREDLQSVALDVDELRTSVTQVKEKVSAVEGAVVLLVASGCWFLLAIVVSTIQVMGHQTETGRMLEAADRSSRGMIISAMTFVLAGARIGANIVMRQGKGRRLERLLTVGAWRGVVLGWTVCALLLYLPTSTRLMRSIYGHETWTTVAVVPTLLNLDVDGVRELLDNGLDPNSVVNGESLVKWAINGTAVGPNFQPLPSAELEARRLRLIELLLSKGARPGASDVEFARSLGKQEVASMLVAAGSTNAR